MLWTHGEVCGSPDVKMFALCHTAATYPGRGFPPSLVSGSKALPPTSSGWELTSSWSPGTSVWEPSTRRYSTPMTCAMWSSEWPGWPQNADSVSPERRQKAHFLLYLNEQQLARNADLKFPIVLKAASSVPEHSKFSLHFSC